MRIFPIALAALVFIAVQPALADDCRKLEDVAEVLAAGGGSMRPLTTRELDFARGLFVAQPHTPAMFPEGDSGLWITTGGRVMVIFTRHGKACEMLGIGSDGQRNFEALNRPAGDPF